MNRGRKKRVLKLAGKPEYNERLKTEYETLRKLRHPLIVEAYDLTEINSLTAFTMTKAGEETLARRLRKEGRLHLELLQRFGKDMIDIVSYLEQMGISHRDIKPDNIGIGSVSSKGRLRLILFDFSLSSASWDNIRAGTPRYIDPFLSEQNRKRWDLHAERFSAAITLYEMTTGTLPRWGTVGATLHCWIPKQPCTRNYLIPTYGMQ